MVAAVVDEIVRALGADAVLSDASEHLPFDSDGLARLRKPWDRLGQLV